MSRRKKILTRLVVVVGLIAISLVYLRFGRSRSIVLQGAVVQQDTDSRKELPIADVQVHQADGDQAHDHH